LKLIQLHKRENHEIILTSASLSNLIEVLRQYFGTTFAISTKLAIQEDRFTGKVSGVIAYGENKAKMAKELVQKYGMSLDGSYAYTDHTSDLPLLEMVDNPIVVNPDRKLKKIAMKNNWQMYPFK
jgi:HAD superfamily hydrolase (TIGR01490 family)